MNRIASRGLLVVLLLACLAQTGCIERRTAMHLKYDEVSDALAVLYVYTQVRCSDKDELNWLLQQWEWRERVIPVAPILSFPAYLRESGDTYRQIDLNDPLKTEAPKQRTDVPLEQIGIKPGDFFQGPDDSLSYSHQILLPGKVLDAGLAKLRPEINERVAAMVSQELQRREDGGVIGSWKKCRDYAARAFEKVEGPMENPPQPEHCLSQESLVLLQSAAAKQAVKVQRDKTSLSIAFPLTEADREGFASVIEAGREAALRKAKERKLPADILSLVESLAAKAGDDDLLTLTVRVPHDLDSSSLDEHDPLTEEQREHAKNTLIFAKANNIPVRTDVKIDDLTAKFHAGK